MDLRNYTIAVRKFWYVILAGFLLGSLLGVYSYVGAETEYRGSVTFFVRTSGEGNAGAAAQADQFAQRRVNSYAALFTSDRFTERVSEGLDGSIDADRVGKMLEATGAIDTVLLTASVTAGSREEAIEVATVVADTFPDMVAEVEGQGVGSTTVSLEVVSGPDVKEVPPSRVNIIGLRMLAGLLLGVAGAVVLQLRDTAVHDAKELEERDLAPVLASIPATRSVETSPLVLEDEQQSVRAEAFRQLRTNLQFLDAERPIRTMLVTSSVAEEGKSVSTANLAILLVATGARVLVIEADLRRPSLSDTFGVDRSAGLTDVLVGRAELDEVIQPWGEGDLSILASGPIPPNPSELLASDAMGGLLEKVGADYDMVLLDSPPLLPVADSVILSRVTDGVVVLARSGKTKWADLERAVTQLNAVGSRVLGIVLNFVPSRSTYGYSAYTSLED